MIFLAGFFVIQNLIFTCLLGDRNQHEFCLEHKGNYYELRGPNLRIEIKKLIFMY